MAILSFDESNQVGCIDFKAGLLYKDKYKPTTKHLGMRNSFVIDGFDGVLAGMIVMITMETSVQMKMEIVMVI